MQAGNFIKKETLTQLFFCEFCKISKNSLFHRTPVVAVSVKNVVYNVIFSCTTKKLKERDWVKNSNIYNLLLLFLSCTTAKERIIISARQTQLNISVNQYSGSPQQGRQMTINFSYMPKVLFFDGEDALNATSICYRSQKEFFVFNLRCI